MPLTLTLRRQKQFGSLSLRSDWSAKLVPGKPGLYKEILFEINKNKKKNRVYIKLNIVG